MSRQIMTLLGPADVDMYYDLDDDGYRRSYADIIRDGERAYRRVPGALIDLLSTAQRFEGWVKKNAVHREPCEWAAHFNEVCTCGLSDLLLEIEG